jgi:glucose dehydrogenase
LVVALRPDTGEYVWHFQTTPAEDWDYTATQYMILADLTIDGRARKVLMQAPKNDSSMCSIARPASSSPAHRT